MKKDYKCSCAEISSNEFKYLGTRQRGLCTTHCSPPPSPHHALVKREGGAALAIHPAVLHVCTHRGVSWVTRSLGITGSKEVLDTVDLKCKCDRLKMKY